MTIRKLNKLLLIAVIGLFGQSTAAERAESFDEALQKAGSDGVIAYCYGPDWNRRSVQLLKTFWNTAETAEIAGNAVLVAVPFYENNNAEGADRAPGIRGNMPAPPFDVCPTVMFFDQSGRNYANMQGSDFLGNDPTCTLGRQNIQKTLQHLRTQQKLLSQAEQAEGKEKAALLSQVLDLPIDAPHGTREQLKNADPTDKGGYVRRAEFNARDFMYQQLDTKDGFIHPDFEADYNQMMRDCEKVFKDEALRNRDRQAVYNLYIGQSRREHIQSNRLKGLIRKVNKLDDTTDYGQLSPTLMTLWGNIKHKATPDERRAARAKKRAADKEKKNKKRGERNIEIN